MLHTHNPIIKHKAGLLNLAEELCNVSKACKVMGFSRDTFYRYQELAQEVGVDALISRSKCTPNLKTVLILPLRKLFLIMPLNNLRMVSIEPVMSYAKQVFSYTVVAFAQFG